MTDKASQADELKIMHGKRNVLVLEKSLLIDEVIGFNLEGK